MGGDEAAHLFRITQLSEGKLLSDKLVSGQYGGQISNNTDQISRLVLLQLPRDNEKSHAFRPPAQYYDLLNQSPSKERVPVLFTGSAIYSPVAYAPMIAGAFLTNNLHSSISTTIYTLRTTNLLAFMALGIFSLWLLKPRKSQWFILTILLLPMSLFEAATINGDAILIGISMLFLSALIRYLRDEQPSRIVWASLFSAAVLMPLVKSLYIFLSLLAPLAVFLHKRPWQRKTLHAWGLVAAICLPSMLWALATQDIVKSNGLIVQNPTSLISANGQIEFIMWHPLQAIGVLGATFVHYYFDFATGIVGMLGMNWVYAPGIVTTAGLIILLVAFSQADDLQKVALRNIRLWRISLAGLALAGILVMVIGFYITFTPVGWPVVRGIQGRYLIPFIPFLLWGIIYGKLSGIGQKIKNSYALIITSVLVADALTMAIVYTQAIRG